MSNPVYVSPILPWDPLPGESNRLRALMAFMLILAFLIWIIVPLVKIPEIKRSEAEAVPERLAKLVVQQKIIPPPPPKKVDEVKPDEARDLAILGEKIRKAAREQFDVTHPDFPNVQDVSIVQFAMPFEGSGKVTRNTCIVAPGRSDRSPTGTGTSARMAVLQAKGQMKAGDELIHASIIGSRFVGKILSVEQAGGRTVIIPQITGRAWITGQHSYLLDPEDPWQTGYMLSDTWGVTPTLKQ